MSKLHSESQMTDFLPGLVPVDVVGFYLIPQVSLEDLWNSGA
jgi:hypothetical protein